jgi:uncharacterized protein YegP (UPF0339 family)
MQPGWKLPEPGYASSRAAIFRCESDRGQTKLRQTDYRAQGGAEIMYKFEIYQDKAGEYRFRFKASNGETMFSSEGYQAKASAIHAIESIKRNSPGADTVDLTAMTA